MPSSDWYTDTDPRALDVFLELQRRLSPGEKIAAVIEMSDALLRLAVEREKNRHPQADDREAFLRAAAQRLDRDTMIRAYGWDPENAPQ